jgi:hypothetical protein
VNLLGDESQTVDSRVKAAVALLGDIRRGV